IGITGGKRLLSYLNANVFGLEMTGMLGDVVIGAFIKKTGQNTAPTFNENRYSNLLSYDFDAAILREYENSEIFKLYTRGFLGAMSTYMIRNRYSDVASPFLDVEFFSFCLSLPLEYRIDHRLYRAWILRKYPEAARLYCVNYAGNLTGNVAWKNTMRKIRKGTEIYSTRLLEKIGVNVKGSPASMNPMDYWYRSDANVRKFIHDYYAENIWRVSATTQLAKDMGYLFQKGSAVDKLLVLTVLAAYKFYDLHWE
ncbi:MAG TPA: hypothetical protein VHO48_09470, partial [Anaerolineaceae bacterium]|nr:hypothetical protein [Anaerolineaceae bacterium]